ncbi:hypothetical protein NC651_035668 [Populus alba x Populus x berolinensis]|nr:hypothetical protein NC651_035668 [Populus alba x Populus x berolinensis]
MDGCPLGGGAYGIVYSATDRAINQAVAVKMIPLLQAEITKRLAGEIYLLYEIEHPNIVRILCNRFSVVPRTATASEFCIVT